jgi:hypothetical protein
MHPAQRRDIVGSVVSGEKWPEAKKLKVLAALGSIRFCKRR